MAFDPVSLGVSLIPSLYKGISSIFQKNRANKINPVNPGYKVNTEVINNARVLGDRAGNYEMPGYNNALENINSSAAQGFNNGVQGATSGGDVLDLATKIAYGRGRNLNDLAAQNAQGADQALLQSLNANAAAGEEYQQKNAYDRDIYQQQLREKAALTQASNENAYQALDTGATAVGSALAPNPYIGTQTNTGGLTPEQIRAYNQFRARKSIASY